MCWLLSSGFVLEIYEFNDEEKMCELIEKILFIHILQMTKVLSFGVPIFNFIIRKFAKLDR